MWVAPNLLRLLSTICYHLQLSFRLTKFVTRQPNPDTFAWVSLIESNLHSRGDLSSVIGVHCLHRGRLVFPPGLPPCGGQQAGCTPLGVVPDVLLWRHCSRLERSRRSVCCGAEHWPKRNDAPKRCPPRHFIFIGLRSENRFRSNIAGGGYGPAFLVCFPSNFQL